MSLVTRHHRADGCDSEAVYSPCECYRYSLTRVWEPGGRRLLYIMLNPSKATELANDPTIERCERRARRLGFGGFRVCNIFAWRETDPVALKRAKQPIGPENAAQIAGAAAWADDILCAWGVHGAHLGQGDAIAQTLVQSGKPILSLGVTKHGHPRHPLYVAYDVAPLPWTNR
jgi:hypothetical protein